MDDLIEATCARIDAAGFHPQRSPLAHRIVMMVASAQGILEAGGYEALFSVPFDPPVALEEFPPLYDALGATAAAGLFRQAIALSRTPDPDFHALDRAQWDGADDVLDLLEAWIGAHATDLP